MIRLSSFRITSAICLVILATFPIGAQKKKTRIQTDEVLIQKRVLREWSTPVFADKNADVQHSNPKIIDGVEAETQIYNLPRELLISTETCNQKTVKNAKHWDYALRGYVTYAVKGRVFGYRVPVVVVIADKGRILERMGAMGIFHYIDEDGSGKFKLRCDKSLEIKTLPQWVKTLATK